METQTLTAPVNGPFAPRHRPAMGEASSAVPLPVVTPVPSSFGTGPYPGATRPAPGTPPKSPAGGPERGNPGRRWARMPSVRRPSPGIVPLGSAGSGWVGECDDSSDHAADHAAGLLDHGPTNYRMGRWARLAVTTTVLVAAALLTVSLLSGPAPRRMVDVTVGPGDTLWSIATAQSPDRDPRAVISEIEQLNGLDGDVLHVGVVLRVPAEQN
jgi:LysM repeat protein